MFVTGNTENSLQNQTRQTRFSDLNTCIQSHFKLSGLRHPSSVGRCDTGPPGDAHPSSPDGSHTGCLRAPQTALEIYAQSRDSSPGFPDKTRLPRFRCELLGIY